MLSITVDKTWSDEPGYIMYYEGVSTIDQKHRILSARSSDGRAWIKNNEQGPVLDIGDDDDETWDCDGVGSPHILRMDDGSQRMYYVGQQQKNTAVGVTKVEYPSNGSKNKVPLSLRSNKPKSS